MSTSKEARDLEIDLKRIYKKINKQYKSITREIIDEIVRKFDDLADVYINEEKLLSNKEKESLNDSLLTKKILNNGEYNEAASIATVLKFYLEYVPIHEYL